MKTITRILILTMLCLSLSFQAALATEALPDKLGTPMNVKLTDLSHPASDYLCNFRLEVEYDKDAEFSTLLNMTDADRIKKYGNEAKNFEAYVQIDWNIDMVSGWVYEEFTNEWDTLSSENSNIWDYSKSIDAKTQKAQILNLYTVESTEWLETGLSDRVSPYTYMGMNGFQIDTPLIDLTKHAVYVKVRYVASLNNGERFIYSDWSDVVSIGTNASKEDIGKENAEVKWSGVSNWALQDVQTCNQIGLYPELLTGEDLRNSVTRREFANIAANLLEQMGVEMSLPENNPFNDTRDRSVLKIYNAGIVKGKTENTFCPMDYISREEVAVIMDRLCTKVAETGRMDKLIKGETVEFADDAEISVWAKDSVYLMVANKIINGIGHGYFAPRNITNQQIKTGYADTSIEQALILALRIYRMRTN